MPYLREQDRKEISTITTGMRNSFGAGVKAIQAWRAYWPSARGLFPRRTRNRNPLARRRNGAVRRLGKSDSSKTIEKQKTFNGGGRWNNPATKEQPKKRMIR